VALLAADMPFLRACQLRALLSAAAPDQGKAYRAAAGDDQPRRRAGDRAAGPVGAVLVDDAGRPQWLAGCWQAAGLRSAAQGYGGASLHALLAPLDPVLVSLDVADGEPPPWLDCDTAEDLGIARGWQRR
jgi:molybdenum cofactor guanylyltransferase